MSAKFTPGPWVVDKVLDLRGNPCAYSVWPSRERLGQRNRIVSTPDGVTAEAKANARLIAAAPEMYQALTLACAVVADVTHCGGDDCTDCAVGIALRKARGEA